MKAFEITTLGSLATGIPIGTVTKVNTYIFSPNPFFWKELKSK